MRFFFFILLSVSACAQSVGDFSIQYRATTSGPQPIKSWAKANSTLWGTNSSGNPQSITIGSGLSLTAGVLTSSGGGGVGTGTVTSVALTLPNIFSVSGSPITESGTLAASLATQTANRVWAGPTTGSAAAPTFRALVAADIPDLSGTYQPLSNRLTEISGIANARGVLYNSGTGLEGYINFSLGGQPATDGGKIPLYNVDGDLNTGRNIYFSVPATGGGYDASTLSAPATLGYTWALPSASGTLALTSQLTLGSLSGLGTGVATAMAVNIGSAGAPVLFNGAGGTPSSITLTNASGTAASLIAGQATAARGILTAGGTVSVSSASAPSAGMRLTATSSTTGDWQYAKAEIVVACSDETTALTTGTAKVTFRMPHAMTLSSVRLNVNTAPTGSVIIVDVKEAGTTLFSTKPQIATSAFTSVGGAVPGTLSDTSLADDAEVTINLDQIGSTIAGKGLKVTLIGTRP